MSDVWLLEEDIHYESKYVMGVYTTGEKAERALKRVKKEIAKQSGLKIQLTADYASETSWEIVCYSFVDVTRDIAYRARKVQTNRRFHA